MWALAAVELCVHKRGVGGGSGGIYHKSFSLFEKSSWYCTFTQNKLGQLLFSTEFPESQYVTPLCSAKDYENCICHWLITKSKTKLLNAHTCILSGWQNLPRWCPWERIPTRRRWWWKCWQCLTCYVLLWTPCAMFWPPVPTSVLSDWLMKGSFLWWDLQGTQRTQS